MMIWYARGGGGVEFRDVPVLCGAGGGLTVHAEMVASALARTAALRKRRLGTPSGYRRARSVRAKSQQ
jgi:hypothetical protein